MKKITFFVILSLTLFLFIACGGNTEVKDDAAGGDSVVKENNAIISYSNNSVDIAKTNLLNMLNDRIANSVDNFIKPPQDKQEEYAKFIDDKVKEKTTKIVEAAKETKYKDFKFAISVEFEKIDTAAKEIVDEAKEKYSVEENETAASKGTIVVWD